MSFCYRIYLIMIGTARLLLQLRLKINSFSVKYVLSSISMSMAWTIASFAVLNSRLFSLFNTRLVSTFTVVGNNTPPFLLSRPRCRGVESHLSVEHLGIDVQALNSSAVGAWKEANLSLDPLNNASVKINL